MIAGGEQTAGIGVDIALSVRRGGIACLGMGGAGIGLAVLGFLGVQLSRILAERFVIGRRWSEAQAIALGRQNLRGNVEAIFLGNNPEEGFLLVD